MKKQNKKLLSGLLIFSSIALCAGIFAKNNGVINPVPGENVNINQNGIKIRMLSSSTNTHGEKDQVFSYTVTPANATEQGVNVVLKYTDGTDCSAVMTSSVDSSKHTITLSCLAPFSKQINAVVTSKANTSATATVKLDYVKKIKGLTAKGSGASHYFYLGEDADGVKNLAPSTFVNPTYSVFTKDKTYTFKAKINSITIENDLTVGAPEAAKTAFINGLKSRIEAGGTYFTADELWNLNNTNAWHSILKATTADDAGNDLNCFEMSASITYTCNENTSVSVTTTYALYGCLYGNYTSKTVGVDSIGVEIGSLEF